MRRLFTGRVGFHLPRPCSNVSLWGRWMWKSISGTTQHTTGWTDVHGSLI